MGTKSATKTTKAADRLVKRAPYKLRPGFVICPEISATGGVSYKRLETREERDGERLDAEMLTHKRVDNVDLVRESKSIIARCYYLLEKHCSSTPLGYFADDEQLAGLEGEIDEMREAARLFNKLAKDLGSARRVHVDVFPLPLDLTSEKIVERIARSVRERLVELRETLQSGQRKAIEKALEDVGNLDKLATGIQADAIRFAVESAREEKSALLDRIRDAGCGPDDIAKLAQLGALCNVDALDAAIVHFGGDAA
jgi:hypothetical protein